jgi:hypothetical protein
MRFFILWMLFMPFSSHATTIEQLKIVPSSDSFNYILVDLGVTDVPRENLSKYALPNTMAPQINDERKMIYNQTDHGCLRDPLGEMSPRLNGAAAYFHGINDRGDLLLSYGRSANDERWALSTQELLPKQKETMIDLGDLMGRNVYLRALNDQCMAVGNFKPGGMLRPIIWTKADGLHHLGYYLGWDVIGTLWGVNSAGTIIGSLTEDGPSVPFVWNKQWGMKRLQSFGWNWKVATRKSLEGPIHFDDLVIASDDRIFGTFHAANTWEDHFVGAFWWDPHTNQVRPLDLQGMRLNAINAKNTLVGSWKGKAALYDLGGKPVLLEELTPQSKNSWELLEASDINSHGDIVGYGLNEGKLHYFLLKREAGKLPGK